MPSYERNKSSGLWSCRFRETDEKGETHQRRLSGYKTKKDAQFAYEDYIKAEEEREAAKKAEEEAKKRLPDEMTFESLYSLFIEYKRDRIKGSTLYDMDSKIQNKILPFFREYKISDITPATVLEWENSLKQYSYCYKKNLFSFLNAIFKFGAKYYNTANVTKDVDRPQKKKGNKKMLFWTPEEFSEVISREPKQPYNAFFMTLYTLGFRRGEAMALSWSDIDFAKKTINIDKNITYKTINKKEGQAYEITTPKNDGSVRTVAVPQFLLDNIAELRPKDNQPDPPFVFGENRPLAPTTLERRLTNAAKAAGVKRIRVHDLRHSCASYLIHSGVSIVAISAQLGHTDVHQTLNTYAHMFPNDQEQVRNNLQALADKINR